MARVPKASVKGSSSSSRYYDSAKYFRSYFVLLGVRVWMLCVVCKDEAKKSPYRCPQCKSPYCSVICFKQHKSDCIPTPMLEPEKQTLRSERQAEEGDSVYATVLNNPRIQELLRFEGVSKYLRVVADILHDAKLSGEHSAEGRRFVALKKLRELRKGGREENEAIEELATTVVKLVDPQAEQEKDGLT